MLVHHEHSYGSIASVGRDRAFFFQAEDGIRDADVTGVQTCALPISLKFLIGGEEVTVREGEVLHIPSWVPHQAEALDDTFELDLFSPIRQDWLDHTDDYFHR